MKRKCVYAKFCKYYEDGLKTCSDEEEASWNCNVYNRFLEYDIKNEEKEITSN